MGCDALRVSLVLVRKSSLGLAARIQAAPCDTPAVEDRRVDPLLDVLAAGSLDDLAYRLAGPGAVGVFWCLAQDLADERVTGAQEAALGEQGAGAGDRLRQLRAARLPRDGPPGPKELVMAMGYPAPRNTA